MRENPKKGAILLMALVVTLTTSLSNSSVRAPCGTDVNIVGTAYVAPVGGSGGSDYYAEPFIATGYFIGNVGAYIWGVATPYPDMRVQLWGDVGGEPDENNVIASSKVILGSTITSTGQRYYINPTSPILVTPGQRYWVVIDGYYDTTTSGSNGSKLDTTNPHPDGDFTYSNDAGSTWTTFTDYDMDIEVTYTCKERRRVEMNDQMQPLATNRISQATDLLSKAQNLCQELSDKEDPKFEECCSENRLNEAKELLEMAEKFFMGGNYIAANNFALKAIAKLEEIIECCEG
ncbi:MAG: hypothetical protein ACE5K0_06020 [Candidatus Methanofastidiosia archaeon]